MFEATTRDRRAERRAATRAEILEAAWALAREGGLASLSLRDVARRVGMQAPSLYSYFDSKAAIYDAMFEQGARQFVEGEPSDELTGDPRNDLRVIWTYAVAFATEDIARYQLLFQRTVPGFEPSPESFAVSVDSLRRITEHLDSMGLGDPGTIDLFTAIGTGLMDQQISNDPGGDRWSRLIDEAVEMFVGHHERRTTTTNRRGRKR